MRIKNKTIPIIITVIILLLFVLGAYFAGHKFGKFKRPHFLQDFIIMNQIIEKPERKPDVVGLIKSVSGNHIIVSRLSRPKNPTFDMKIKERRRYLDSMNKEERIKLLEESYSASIGEDIEIIIPVESPIVKREISIDEKTLNQFKINLGDLISKQHIMAWLDPGTVNQNIAEIIIINVKK